MAEVKGPTSSNSSAGSQTKNQANQSKVDKDLEDVQSPSDEDFAAEEAKQREAGLAFASKVNNSSDPIILEDDDEATSWLVANGYAELHAIQDEGDINNYVLLTEEGVRALQTYNPKEQ